MLHDPVTAPRTHLVRALEADLVGPYDVQEPEEVLPMSPSRWYLTGFLAPQDGRDLEEEEGEGEMAAGSDVDDPDAGGHEPEPKLKNILPASLGLSVLLPPAEEGAPDVVRATLHYSEYRAGQDDVDGRVWTRQVREPVTVELPLEPRRVERGIELETPDGVWIGGRIAGAEASGTRALSLFVVNHRAPAEVRGYQAERFLFQVYLELEVPRGLVPRPQVRDASRDWDERVADLHYREHVEWAVGHGASVEVLDGAEDDGVVRRVRTTWIPRAVVPHVVTRELDADASPHFTTAMEELAELEGGDAARRALEPLVGAYGAWLEAQAGIDPGTEARRRTRDRLLEEAERARLRIAEGIELLARGGEALEAFRLANRAMALQARRRNPERYPEGERPRWRLFQLAFVLLNLPSLEDGEHPDRETVELIFFPTGGGKTEAYLGVIAFTVVLRRLRGAARPDGGEGVAVLLRYTLRLLTLDQLDRAATLICALEILRREDPARLGETRFAVGLWVGKSATANTFDQVAEQIGEYKRNTSPNATSPFPLERCPWCREELGKESLTLVPKDHPREVAVGCTNFRCEFSRGRHAEGLPVLFVDEQIYRELPAFLIATVDKFAMLPWRGETGMLFGHATHRSRDGSRRFFGPMDGPAPRTEDGPAERLPEGLRPPELIVQDELHLISGPLGTMVGLYETAIEALCLRETGLRETGMGAEVVGKPKILASTATVRRAREQIRALFGRRRHAVFPPPAVEPSETFFARVAHDVPGRLYVGVAAPGRPMKAVLLRTYVALLAAARKVWDGRGRAGVEDVTADAYLTLAGYFNSLRELGGMRRLVEDEVLARCRRISRRRPSSADGRRGHRWFADRALRSEPVELTSREPSARIKAAKERLAQPWTDEKQRVDVLLASNMISVGVDIDRLGLMVVAGQPKTTAEYIQASSRVGRQPKTRPGLVVTCLNVHKPRDRSHWEHFTAYHESFYRRVEASSLTPFSGPALDRGLAGTLVSMARHGAEEMTPPHGLLEIEQHGELVRRICERFAERGAALARSSGEEGASADGPRAELEAMARDFYDAWARIAYRARHEEAAARELTYSPYDRERRSRALLFTVLDRERAPRVEGSPDAKFEAPTSMRDVEPSVHLWLERRTLGGGR